MTTPRPRSTALSTTDAHGGTSSIGCGKFKGSCGAKPIGRICYGDTGCEKEKPPANQCGHMCPAPPKTDGWYGQGSGEQSQDGPSGSSLGPNQLAWCVQVGPVVCQRANQARKDALELEQQYHDPNWSTGQTNAFRHALWHGLMTSRGVSVEDAHTLGVAHEMDGDDPDETWGSNDSKADLHNNDVGARLGIEASSTAAVNAYRYHFDTSPEKLMTATLVTMVNNKQELDFSSTHG